MGGGLWRRAFGAEAATREEGAPPREQLRRRGREAGAGPLASALCWRRASARDARARRAPFSEKQHRRAPAGEKLATFPLQLRYQISPKGTDSAV